MDPMGYKLTCKQLEAIPKDDHPPDVKTMSRTASLDCIYGGVWMELLDQK